MTGKIIKGIAGFYYVHDGHETVYECRAKGIFRSRGIKPVVGDNVEFVVLDEEKAEGSIEEDSAPQKTCLSVRHRQMWIRRLWCLRSHSRSRI